MCTHQRFHMDVSPRNTAALRLAPAGSCAGFTLLETLCAAALIALLAAIALPAYQGVIERQKIQQCSNDLMKISVMIERFRNENHYDLPNSLNQLSGSVPTDPWGNAYQYLSFNSGEPGVKGKIRKDHNLHPLNSEFDLYSNGPDGSSAAPLTAKASRDDVIWARDGAFIGKASDF
jgi:general secretion pathway protein G